jgi:hypothetical protein
MLYYHKALQLKALRKFPDVLCLLNQALSIDPTDPFLLSELAILSEK